MRKEREIYSKLIDEFCNTYYNINERDPFQNEIIDNMKSKIKETIFFSLIHDKFPKSGMDKI